MFFFFFPPFFLIVFHVLVAIWYREKLRSKYGSDVAAYNSLSGVRMQANDFDSGLFDCFNGHKSVRKCCFACFCTPVRWSADASATGLMDFWIALILSSIFVSVIFIFGLIGRIHIRAGSGMVRQPIADCCSWFWCYSCAMTQEAKFVDKGFSAIRDGRTEIMLESQPPVASIVQKRPLETPATTPPASPESGVQVSSA